MRACVCERTSVSMCVCVCVRARARACEDVFVRVSLCVCLHASINHTKSHPARIKPFQYELSLSYLWCYCDFQRRSRSPGTSTNGSVR